jgi:hypothetical protein
MAQKQTTIHTPPPITTRAHSPKTTSLLRLATQHNHKCKKKSSNIPPRTKTADKFKGRLEIYTSTCPKDERNETVKKHSLSVRAHMNDQTSLTIYTDGSKTEERMGTSYITYYKGRLVAKKSLGMGNKAEAFDGPSPKA